MHTEWTEQVHLSVVIDNPAVTPNAPLTGKICVNITTEKVECSHLSITFVGAELAVVECSGGEDTESHEARADFLNFSFDITEFDDGCIPRGNYEYPFSCFIPNGLPATMQCSFHDSNCSVQYAAVGKLSSGREQISGRSVFYVSSRRPLIQSGQVYLDSYYHTMKRFCGLLDGGNIVVGASLSSHFLVVDQVHTVQYAVQNNSSVEVSSVELTITETVKWCAGEYAADKVHTVYRMMHQLDLGKEGRGTGGSSGQVADSESYLQKLRDSLIESLDTGVGSINVCLAPGTRNTHHGDVLDVTHELCIQFGTSSGPPVPPICIDVFICGSAFEERVHTELAPTNATDGGQLMSNSPVISASVTEMTLGEYVDPVVISRLQSFKSDAPQSEVIRRNASIARSLTNSSMPRAQSIVGNFSLLEQHLVGSFDQVEAFDAWCETNEVSSLSPSNLCDIFGAIRSATDQIEIADKLGRLLPAVTCQQCAEAAKGCMTSLERTIVEKLVAPIGKVADPDNYKLVEDQMTSRFQMVTLEKYF